MKLGKPIKYLAVDPGEVVERVKKLMVRNANEKVKVLTELKGTDVLSELDLLHRQGIQFVEPTDLSGALRGRPNLYTHLETLVKAAEKSVVLVTTGKGLVRKVEALKPELEKLNKKGVEIKIAATMDKEAVKAAKEVSKIADVRVLDNLSARFSIIDGKDLMFMVMDDEKIHPTYDVGVWVKTPYFGEALQSMFDVVWDGLKEF
jgi:sugar-specific transcriptional regulator TrmB